MHRCRLFRTHCSPRAGFRFSSFFDCATDVELRPAGQVAATISAFPKSGRWFTGLGGPARRVAQRVMVRRQLDTLTDEDRAGRRSAAAAIVSAAASSASAACQSGIRRPAHCRHHAPP
ncbi:DUF1990 family protein [Rhodococcus opacus]|nr:DUF1990 family protein [Rhodococcus opacus]